MNPLRSIRLVLPAGAVFSLGVVLTVMLFVWVKDAARAKLKHEFDTLAKDRAWAVQQSVDQHLRELLAIEAFLDANEGGDGIRAGTKLDEDKFAEFATQLVRSHLGVHAVEWVPRVPSSDRESLERELGVDIHDTAGRRVDDRADTFPVVCVVPRGPNQKAIGLDLASDPVRGAALAAARESGRPCVSGRIHLVQEPEDQYSILVFRPCFAGRVQGAATPDELVGFVVGVFRTGDLLESGLAFMNAGEVDVVLTDESAAPNARFLAAFGSGASALAEKQPSGPFPTTAEPVEVPGRKWRLTCIPTESFLASRKSLAHWIVLAAGLLGSGMLAGTVFLASDRRHAIEALVRARTQELETARDEARDAMRAKDDFLAMISHEIRTPMNGVIGMVHLLLDSSLDERQRRYARTIQSSGRELMGILDDILDYAKLDAGRIRLEEVPFDVRRVALGVVELFRPTASPDTRVSCSTDDRVPARVLGDPGRLRQVLVNLVGNAVKFTHEGDVQLVITSDTTSPRVGQPTFLRFEVRDTGIGIPSEALDEIFVPFSQVDASTTRTYGGTGLGLAISKSLVECMGGSIDVESRVGAGSCFRFVVPFKVADPESDDLPGGLRQANGAPRKRRILLVEDDPVSRIVTENMLERLGHRARLANDGAEALEAFAEERFDAVLMDCRMPGMDGYETTRKLREMEPEGRHTPVIALTAGKLSSEKLASSEAGMDDHITKPVDFDQLARTLGKWME